MIFLKSHENSSLPKRHLVNGHQTQVVCMLTVNIFLFKIMIKGRSVKSVHVYLIRLACYIMLCMNFVLFLIFIHLKKENQINYINHPNLQMSFAERILQVIK